MDNILQLFKKPKEPVKSEAPRPMFTFEELRAHDYRSEHLHLNHKVRLIDLAYGSVFASCAKKDSEASEILAKYFAKISIEGAYHGTLRDLPPFTWGYVATKDKCQLGHLQAYVSGPVKQQTDS